jgi:hypothetical protein
LHRRVGSRAKKEKKPPMIGSFFVLVAGERNQLNLLLQALA